MLYLHSLGHYHPPNIIDNAFLESLDIGTSNDWILERVGIDERRTVLPLDYIRDSRNQDTREAQQVALVSNAESAAEAARMAMRRANVSSDDIGMVIAGGCSPDTVTPAEACVVAAELGINAESFDLNSACSSFGAHLHFLNRMRPEALPEFVLVVSPENNTRTINYNDRSTAVLWGDGASAAILSTKVPGRAIVKPDIMESSPAGWDKVLIRRTGHFGQEGKTVQTFAIKRTVRCFRSLQAKYPGSQPWFIGHQANLRMLESSCERCGVAENQHLYNVDRYGNTGAAGAPIVLSQNWEQRQPGDVVAMVVVGAGLTWSSVAIEFQEPGSNG